MIRRLARAVLGLALMGSLAATGLTAARIARDPALTPFTEAAADEIRAASDRAMARHAPPEAILARLAKRLAEEPPNPVTVEALAELAAEQGLTLPPTPPPVSKSCARRRCGRMPRAASPASGTRPPAASRPSFSVRRPWC